MKSLNTQASPQNRLSVYSSLQARQVKGGDEEAGQLPKDSVGFTIEVSSEHQIPKSWINKSRSSCNRGTGDINLNKNYAENEHQVPQGWLNRNRSVGTPSRDRVNLNSLYGHDSMNPLPELILHPFGPKAEGLEHSAAHR
jgi:hypothetical protein